MRIYQISCPEAFFNFEVIQKSLKGASTVTLQIFFSIALPLQDIIKFELLSNSMNSCQHVIQQLRESFICGQFNNIPMSQSSQRSFIIKLTSFATYS